MTSTDLQRTRTGFRIACVFFLCALMAHGAGSQRNLPEAPSFIARDIHNRLVSLDSLLNNGPVIVDFWATWCVPCMLELKALKKLSKKYKDKNLTIIAVSLDNQAEIAAVKQMTAANRWPFTVIVDIGKKISEKYHVTSVPALFLIDTDGKISYSSRGYVTGDEVKLEEAINGLSDP
jgi:cytochrome c biogenesis protein CcmG/thiol:disulfide interchange protein DsbE